MTTLKLTRHAIDRINGQEVYREETSFFSPAVEGDPRAIEVEGYEGLKWIWVSTTNPFFDAAQYSVDANRAAEAVGSDVSQPFVVSPYILALRPEVKLISEREYLDGIQRETLAWDAVKDQLLADGVRSVSETRDAKLAVLRRLGLSSEEAELLLR